MQDNEQNGKWSLEDRVISDLSLDKMRSHDPWWRRNRKTILVSMVFLCLFASIAGAILFQRYSKTISASHLSQPAKSAQKGFSPVIANEASGIVTIVSKMDTLQGYQAKKGKLLWQTVLPHSQIFAIETTGTYLYVAAKQQNLSVVLEFNLVYGSQVWKRVLPSFSSHPLIAGGDVIYTNALDGEVRALRASDGFLLWKFASGQNGPPFDTFMERIPGAAAIWGSDKQMHIIRNADGKELLHYSVIDGEHWVHTLSGAILYARPKEGQLRAFDIRTGRQIWQQNFINPQIQYWTMQNDILYVTLADGSMQARSGKNNTLLWQSERYGQVANGPQVDQGVVSYTTQTSTLIGLRISNGKLIWKKTLEHYKYGPMLAAGVLLWGNEKDIEGLQVTTGKSLWHYTTAYPMLWYPRSSDGLLFLSQDHQNLDVIHIDNGNMAWHYVER